MIFKYFRDIKPAHFMNNKKAMVSMILKTDFVTIGFHKQYRMAKFGEVG